MNFKKYFYQGSKPKFTIFDGNSSDPNLRMTSSVSLIRNQNEDNVEVNCHGQVSLFKITSPLLPCITNVASMAFFVDSGTTSFHLIVTGSLLKRSQVNL